MTAGRAVHVFDAGGVLLGSFGGVEEAHVWAHGEAVSPGVALPLEVDDRLVRVTTFVGAGRCWSSRWMAVAVEAARCPLLPAPAAWGPPPAWALR